MFSEILNDKQGDFDDIDYSESVDFLIPNPPTEEEIKQFLAERSIMGV